LSDCFITAALLLLGFDDGIDGGRLLPCMMHGAFWICADAAQLALLAAFGDDGLGGELARLVLRPIALLRVGWLLGVNLNVLVARDH